MMIKGKEPEAKKTYEDNKELEAKMQVFAQAQQNGVEGAEKLLETFQKDSKEE